MKKLAIVFIGFFFIAFSMNVNAQTTSATQSGSSSATILEDILLTVGQPLEFGAIGNASIGGSVTIDPDGSVSSITGISHPVSGNDGQNATFSVQGSYDATYTIKLLDGALTEFKISNADGDELTVSNFVTDPRNDPGTTFSGPSGTGTLSSSGSEDLWIGATLTVPANTPGGVYTGNYDVTVAYN